MFQSQNQKGISPVFALIAIAAMVSMTGFTIKYASDSQSAIDDEISFQEDLVLKSNVALIKKNAAKEKQGGQEGEILYSMIKTSAGFLFPEITSFEDEVIKTKVNARLQKEAEAFCKCDDVELIGCDVNTEVTYNSSYIFSLATFSNWSCEKQLHDARGFSNLVFDMKNGEPVGFNDVFGPPISPLGQQISDGLARLIKKNLKNIAECPDDYDEESIKNYSYSYFITKEGVAFTPEISYAGLMCTEHIIVSIADVEPLAEPNSILERLVKKDAVKELQSGNEETSDWKTYRNEKYGFEIKYPSNVALLDEKDYGVPYDDLLLVVKFGENGKAYCAEYDIEVNNTKYEDVVSWAANTVEKIQSPSDYEGGTIEARNVLSASNLNIGNIDAKKIISDGGFPFWNGYFGAIKEGKIYNVYYGDLTTIDSDKRKPACFGRGGDEAKYLNIYNQMLSTFRFIESNNDMTAVYGPKNLPEFDNFPVSDIFSGKPAPVDFSTPNAVNFKTRLTEGAAKGPNFAGHYTVVTWGCGTSCVVVSLVDAKTGAVYMLAGANPWAKLEYRLDSSLMIENGDVQLGKKLDAERSALSFTTDYAVWQNDQLKLIYSRDYSKEAVN